MIRTQILSLMACLFSGVALAASSTELEAVFAKATKKGASAVYHDRCKADGTSSGGLVFNDNSMMGLVKAMGALATAVAIKDHGDGCSAGLLPGQERYYEIYPDGSVKTK